MGTFMEMKDLKESDEHAPGVEKKVGSLSALSPIFSSVGSRVFLLVLSWWSASILVVLLIKSIIAEAGSPNAFALSGFTNVSTGVMACLFIRSCSCTSHPMPVTLTWRESLKLALLGFIQGVEIACNNKSLEYLSVSARTMASSINVLFMMLTARAWGLEKLGCMRLVSAALLLVGGALQGVDHLGSQADTEADAYSRGMLLQFGAMFTASQRWALVQSITQRSPHGSALAQMSKSKLHLVQRTLPITGGVCLLLSFCFEPESYSSSWLSAGLVLKMLGIASGIVILTVSELEIVRIVSAVAIQILGTLHQIPVALAGIFFFSETVHVLSWFGFALCILGGLCYVKVRYRELQAGSSPAARFDETPTESAEHGLLNA